jgi:hypothetical protein
MKLQIKDKKILKLLNDKSDNADKAYKKTEEMKEIEKEYNKLIGKVKRLDEKVRPLIKDYTKDVKFGEFEEISRIYKDDKGKWQIEITDRLKEFKEGFKKMKENKGKQKSK